MEIDQNGKSDTWRKGLQTRRKVLGDEYVDKAFRDADDLTADLQNYITEHAWGASWTRPGLDHRSRSMITVSMTIALNRPHELEIHLRGAIRNGLTRDELKEIMLHAAVYCGAPAALDAFRVARKVFAEMGV
ncbi:MAG: 4-carboxymuconolactone decarboxylase [Betaproteobacteria bacterium]|nr:4-carboxymuconolactone decarboxylase [Betaproteobacteria bacterium]